MGKLTLRMLELLVSSLILDDAIEHCRRMDRAIITVVSEMLATGNSIGKIQKVADTASIRRQSEDRESAICERLDSEVDELVTRPLAA